MALKHFFVILYVLLIMTISVRVEADVTESVSPQAVYDVFIAYDQQELYEIMSDQLLARSEDFYIDYQGDLDKELKKIGKQLNSKKTETYWNGMYMLLQNMAEAVDDPESTSDSDYLTGIIDSAFIYYADGIFCFENVEYYETKKQTKIVDKKIKKVLKRLELDQEEDAVAVVDKVHRYIINRISYDYRNENKCNYSAYHGLIKQRTVCNGYALLAYKMLNQLGVQCKYISGMAKNEVGNKQLHAWNIVKIGKKWYNLDTTWDDSDDGRVYYDYFLRGSKYFSKDHTADRWYLTDQFAEKYKIARKDYKS